VKRQNVAYLLRARRRHPINEYRLPLMRFPNGVRLSVQSRPEYEFDFGRCRFQDRGLILHASRPLHAVKRQRSCCNAPSLSGSYPQATGFYQTGFDPAAYGAQLHCAAAGQDTEGFLV
jgi:hypothetical protein